MKRIALHTLAVLAVLPGGRPGEVGRKGEGPGEFEWPTSIQILAGDSLLVFGGGLARITVFEPQTLTVAYTTTLPAIKVDEVGVEGGVMYDLISG